MPDRRCSFCQKPAPAVEKLVAGPGIFICNECVDACVEIIESAPPTPDPAEPQLPRRHSMTDAQVLEVLPRIAAVASQVEGGLLQWVDEARRRGASWADIGDALGMTRQSAWERFARAGGDAA